MASVEAMIACSLEISAVVIVIVIVEVRRARVTPVISIEPIFDGCMVAVPSSEVEPESSRLLI